jgi:hypothetical protein
VNITRPDALSGRSGNPGEQEDNPMNPEAKQTIKHLQEKLLELKEYL